MLDAAPQPIEEERLPWPDDWVTSRDPADHYRCQMMWCSVLSQCVASMLNRFLQPRTVTRDERRSQALYKDGPVVSTDWLGSRDFHMICALAGFDGVAVCERLTRAMETPQGARAVLESLHSGQGRWGARNDD
jgi:hypothetical protein